MNDISAAVFAACLSLVISLILAVIQCGNQKAKRSVEDRAERRRQESMLSLEMMMANNRLSYACAMAIKRGSPNGEIEEAVEAYETAKAKYDSFIRQMAIEQMRR